MFLVYLAWFRILYFTDLLAIIIAILGLLGVYISKMDIRIAAIQYIILGLGLFIAIGYYG